MQKMLVVDYEKCTGCRLCELVCAVKHEGVSNPLRARIHIVKWEMKGIMVPMICNQCESAPCISVCPTNARTRDEEQRKVNVDYDKCIGCKMCIVACPFGAVSFDPFASRIISCDLCDGDPRCADFCETGALRYVEASQSNKQRQREAAEKLYESMRKFTAAYTG
ncbi:MAG: 4Fe-4S dicluster domain-containing protein [Chloroflexi bacterium]|nr:4Fe-4S dicluster domain-containing protein [Chloroflexota bacterium]